jgi:putative transcriptional regulator
MRSLAGSFLVARPVLDDPNFAQAVVLLLQHTGEGAFGLVVNRPMPVEGAPFPIYYGGPCSESAGLLMLHGHADWADSASESPGREVAPGIYLGDASCLKRLNDAPSDQPPRCRLFAGFAGWGPDQLEGELTQAAWAVVPATGELLFDCPAEGLWSRILPPLARPSMN